MTDLLIAGAHLADGERRDLGVAGGRLVDPSELSSPERIDAPTVSTVGTAYRLTQTSPPANGFFSITARSVAFRSASRT